MNLLDMAPETLQVIVYNMEMDGSLKSIDQWDQTFHHCTTKNDMKSLMRAASSAKKILCCHHELFIDLIDLIKKYDVPNIEKIFILTNGKEMFYPIELLDRSTETIEISSKKNLFRHLLAEAIVFYDGQASKHKREGNRSLAIEPSVRALELFHTLRKM